MFEDLKPHLVELRKRLAVSVGTLFVMFFVCFTFWQPLLAWMLEPLKLVLPPESSVIFTALQEPFFTALKVSFFASFIISLPIIFWQFWLFVAPGLYENEKRLVIPFVLFATVMFLMGASFCYYVVIPLGFEFLVNFGGELFTALPSIGSMLAFLQNFFLVLG